MTKEYKRKFLVDGNTIKDCWDFRKKCGKKYGSNDNRPCRKEDRWRKDESKCPYPINQPTKYIVAETLDGEWQCSCPVWKFRRQQCHHIRKAQMNPEKYQIAKEHTGKSIKTFAKIFGKEE